MKKYLLAPFLLVVLAVAAHAEQRFEVLRLESRGTGDLFSVIDRGGRALTTEEARIQDELRRFYRDGELEYARNYRSGRLREVARNTGLLEVLHADNVPRGCTATAISDRLLLTNSHCIPFEGSQRAVRGRFFLGFETDDRAALAGSLGIVVELPAIEQNERLDYALLRLSNPILDYQPLRIAAIRDPGIEEALVILGFPGGHPLSVARLNCRTTDRPIQDYTMFHLCRTYQGNSGSLLFADDWSLVGLHHLGIYDDITGEKTELSLGIRMTAILAESPLLRASLAVAPPSIRPAPPASGPSALSPDAGTPRGGADTELVRRVQAALIQRGCLSGTADGVVGSRTREAIRRYNQTNQAAISPDRLKLNDPETILSQLSQRCETPNVAARTVCFNFNGRTICE